TAADRRMLFLTFMTCPLGPKAVDCTACVFVRTNRVPSDSSRTLRDKSNGSSGGHCEAAMFVRVTIHLVRKQRWRCLFSGDTRRARRPFSTGAPTAMEREAGSAEAVTAGWSAAEWATLGAAD